MNPQNGVIISLSPDNPSFSVGALLFNNFNDVYKTERNTESTYISGPWKITLDIDDIMIQLNNDHNAVFHFKNLPPLTWNTMKEALEKAVVRTQSSKRTAVRGVADISEAKNIPEDIEKKIKSYLGGRKKTRRTTRRTRVK